MHGDIFMGKDTDTKSLYGPDESQQAATSSVESSQPAEKHVRQTKEDLNKRIRVKIASDPNDPMGMSEVVLGCNGEVVRVKRDVVVPLKMKHFYALKDATRKVYDRGPNGEITGERLSPRYSFSVEG